MEIQKKQSIAASDMGVVSQFTKERDYWLNQLSGELTRSSFPRDYRHKRGGDTGVYRFDFPADMDVRFKQICNRSDVRLYVILLAGVAALLRRYTGHDDIIVGAPIYRQEEAGDYINTVLALRNRLEPDMPMRQVLMTVGETLFQANENMNYPINTLVYKLGLEVGAEGECPLFDVAVLLENLHDEDHLHSLKPGMIFSFERQGDHVAGGIRYDKAAYDESTPQRLATHLQNLLSAAFSDINMPVGQIPILSDEEKNLLIRDYNRPSKEIPMDRTVPQWFAQQVEKTPTQTALVFRENHITFGELDRLTHQMAARLREKGVGPDVVTGVIMEPSAGIIISLLSILKAGGAYLPIDTSLPPYRIEYILKDSSTGVLLTDDTSRRMVVDFSGEVLVLDHADNGPDSGTAVDAVDAICPRHLAYIIYTSGSTGKPKGVMVDHGNLTAYLYAFFHEFQLTGWDVVLQQASYSFDAFVEEMYPPLLSGGRLVIPTREEVVDFDLLTGFITKHCVTMISCSPLLINELNREPASLRTLRILISGGDVLKGEYVDSLCDSHQVYNTYGPTEGTVCATYYRCKEDEPPDVPIGKPIANYQVYIMDTEGGLAGIGVPGELCIAGAGVTRGYLNRPELTADRFVRHPELTLSAVPTDSGDSPVVSLSANRDAGQSDSHHMSTDGAGERLYRTGDLARWMGRLPGMLEFLGRIDNQVKIRGYRIELAEIESCLLRFENIREAVVTLVTDTDGDNSICAYYTTEGELDTAELKQYLSSRLPTYMVPAFLVAMERIPRLVSGKANKKALPRPQVTAEEDRVAPRDAMEEKMARTWSNVLNLDQDVIGIDSNFFDLGGHSLKTTLLVAELHREFSVKVPLQEVFKSPTIRELADYVKKTGKKERFAGIEAVEEKEYYVLSSAQKRLYILWQMEPEAVVYNMPAAFELWGEADVPFLESLFRKLILRHESLRTSFHLIEGQPVQRIHRDVSFDIRYRELDEAVAGTGKRDYFKDLIDERVNPFDLSRAPLLRVFLLKIKAQRYILLLDMHHIISDGFSDRLLIEDFLTLSNGEEPDAFGIRYRDYAVWQTGDGEKKLLARQKKFWQEQFSGDIPILDLPCDYDRPVIQSFAGHSLTFIINAENTEALNRLALREGATLFMVILSLFSMLLFRLTDQEDIVTGIPSAGRRHADLEKLIGLFVNTLALRNFPNGKLTFKAFLSSVRQRAMAAFENQEYQYEDLVDLVGVPRDMGRNPLFDVMFVMQNLESSELSIPGMTLKPMEIPLNTAKFDLTLLVVEERNRLRCRVEYARALFEERTIRRFIGYFKNLLSAVLQNSGIKLSEPDMLAEEEKYQLVYGFNRTDADYPRHKPIHCLFEEQAAQTPEEIALEPAGHAQDDAEPPEPVTYRELNNAANRLARDLIQKGVGAGEIVGIPAQPSLSVVVSILSILKTGAAYLPLDDSLPAARIDSIRADSGVRLVLTQADGADALKAPKDGDSRGNPEVTIDSSDPAYVIYTSGSTGVPKGVLVEHRGLVNYVKWAEKHYALGSIHPEATSSPEENKNIPLTGFQGEPPFGPPGGPSESHRRSDSSIPITDAATSLNFPLYSSLAFDLTVTSVYVPLISGGKIRVYETEESGSVLRRIFEEDRVNVVKLTPTHLKILKEFACQCVNIRTLIIGGEALPTNLAREIYEHFNGRVAIFNEYGPTETVVGCMIHRYDPGRDTGVSIPIGRPADNVQIYLLDRYRRPLPVGCVGEIYISGDGVCPGYLNRSLMSAEQFMENPFQPGKRMYRSGDKARRLPSGDLEFCGRADLQVKIRGFRIELGEIESRLAAHPLIDEAVVAAAGKSSESQVLCGYYTSAEELDGEQIKNYLAEILPDYMIPPHIMYLEALPLTASGKVDRAALPVPGRTVRRAVTPPRDDVEKKLAGCWARLLEIEAQGIGIEDNFFDLGGNSLSALLLVSRVHREFNVKIPLSEIFKRPVISKQARYIKDADKEVFVFIEEAERKPYYPLSPAQKGLFVQQNLYRSSVAYNMPQGFKLTGEVDAELFRNIFLRLIQRHEVLRTSFQLIDGQPVQLIRDQMVFNMETHEYKETVLTDSLDSLPDDLVESFIQPFDLSRPPLLRAALVAVGKGGHLLLVDMHHIITDGISQDIFVREFLALMKGEELAPLRLQYKDFSQWQNKKSRRETRQKQQSYWLRQFEDDIPRLNLAYDYERPSLPTFQGGIVPFILDETLSDKLEELARQSGVTPYMVLLGSFYILLHKLTGSNDLVVGTPVTGRTHADLYDLMGMFVNMLALRCRLQPDHTFQDCLTVVEELVIKGMENQDYHFEELIAHLGQQGEYSRNPLFDVVFSMQVEGFESLEQTSRQMTEELIFTPLGFDSSVSRFDLLIHALKRENQFHLKLEYAVELFSRGTIQELARQYTAVLQQAAEQPDRRLQDFDVSPMPDEHRITVDKTPGSEWSFDF